MDDETFGIHPRPLSADVVREAAAGIRVVHDPTATDDPRFMEARELILNARRVAFVGFGYHPTNLARLDLPSCLQGELVREGGPYASTFEMASTEIAVATGAIGVEARFASPSLDALGFFKEFLVLT